MPMNKVVHAAQRAAFSAAIDSAIKAVRGKGPENMAEQAVKLVNLAQPLLAHRYPDADWDKVRAFVSDPNSKWMGYAYKAINEIDPHILKMNALNLVYPDTLVFGKEVPLINSAHAREELIQRLFGIESVVFIHFDTFADRRRPR